MRAVFYADAAVFTDDGGRIVIRKIDCFDNAVFGALFTVDTLFFIEHHAAAGSFCQRAGRAGVHAGDVPRAGQAVRGKKLAGNSAECSYFYRTFIVRKRLVVDTGAYPLAGKAPDTFVHVVRP